MADSTNIAALGYAKALSSQFEGSLTRESGNTYDDPIRSNASINLCLYQRIEIVSRLKDTGLIMGLSKLIEGGLPGSQSTITPLDNIDRSKAAYVEPSGTYNIVPAWHSHSKVLSRYQQLKVQLSRFESTTVMGILGAFGKMNLHSGKRLLSLQFSTTGHHPAPLSPSPWAQMTVEVCLVKAGTIKGFDMTEMLTIRIILVKMFAPSSWQEGGASGAEPLRNKSAAVIIVAYVLVILRQPDNTIMFSGISLNLRFFILALSNAYHLQ